MARSQRQRSVQISQAANGFTVSWDGHDTQHEHHSGMLVFMAPDQLLKWLTSFFSRKPLKDSLK